jgi:hypothetical protein
MLCKVKKESRKRKADEQKNGEVAKKIKKEKNLKAEVEDSSEKV